MTRPLFLLFGLLVSFAALAAEIPPDDVRTYDPNPHHLWNRLHQTLFIRVGPDGTSYGHDRIDPLFWGATRHLLEEPSHRRALNVLDEFLNKDGERLIRDPQKRAFLQHDLWALFDWSASPSRSHQRERAELQLRLAKIIRRLTLSRQELNSLSDNYARAVAANASAALPRGLFLRDGDWVSLTTSLGTAPHHLQNFQGRSTFHVLLRLPEGRAATLAYVEQLNSFKRPWIYVDSSEAGYSTVLNPSLPQFPSGTEWALVRRMRVIDAGGALRSTPIIESIQLRRYVVVPQGGRFDSFDAMINAQQVLEFVASRIGGDLREVRPGERDFYQFQAHDTDPFELSAEDLSHYRGPDPFRNRLQREVLRGCFTCHAAYGIHSVQSFAQIANGRLLLAPTFAEADPEQIPSEVYWNSYQTGLLRGLWGRSGRP